MMRLGWLHTLAPVALLYHLVLNLWPNLNRNEVHWPSLCSMSPHFPLFEFWFGLSRYLGHIIFACGQLFLDGVPWLIVPKISILVPHLQLYIIVVSILWRLLNTSGLAMPNVILCIGFPTLRHGYLVLLRLSMFLQAKFIMQLSVWLGQFLLIILIAFGNDAGVSTHGGSVTKD